MPKFIKLIQNSLNSIIGAPIRNLLVTLGIVIAVILYSSGSMISDAMLNEKIQMYQNFKDDVALFLNPKENETEYMKSKYNGCEYYRYYSKTVKINGFKNINDDLLINIVGVPFDYLGNSVLSVDLDDCLEITKFGVGYEFSKKDYKLANKVFHMNHSYARLLFGDDYKIGENELEIDGRTFVLVGVLEDTPDVTRNVRKLNRSESKTITIYIPYTTSLCVFDNLSYYEIYRFGNVNMDLILGDMKTNIGGGKVVTKNMISQQFIEENTSMKIVLMLWMGFISIISCFVITITMLFSVRERVFEIGIKLAIGSSRDDIAFSFIVESIINSIIGAIVGILISFLVLLVYSFVKYLETDYFMISINPINDIVFPMSFAILVATITSLTPALIAASTNVISCLKVD